MAPCGSSQGNEAFNYIVTTKHPKSNFYGGSESHANRVGMAVCQKNIGYDFICNINIALNISPGKYTGEYRARKQKRKIDEIRKKQLIPTKRRRLMLKKRSKNSKLSRQEGITYKSGIGYIDTSDLIDETLIADNVNLDVCRSVVFDIETTGLAKTDEIIQIAAKSDEMLFEVYMMPTKDIKPGATEATGFTIRNKQLFYFEERIETCSASDGFLSFLYFLKMQRAPCILIAHNAFRFDAPRIIAMATVLGLLNELKTFVKGFVDTLHVFKEILPDRRKRRESFSQFSLVSEFLDKEHVLVAHNATNDVIMLSNLLDKLQVPRSFMIRNTRSFNFIEKAKERKMKIKAMKDSLLPLHQSNIMRSRIANAGIDMELLRVTYKIGDYNGLQLLLAESINNKPRVTNNKNVIQNIYERLKSEDLLQ